MPSRIHLDRAVRTMLAGGVLAYPTEAVWGLGCLALEHAAVLLVGQGGALGVPLLETGEKVPLLEREAEKAGGGPTFRRVVEELLVHLRAGDVETLRREYVELFAQVTHTSDDFARVRQLVNDHFESTLA